MDVETLLQRFQSLQLTLSTEIGEQKRQRDEEWRRNYVTITRLLWKSASPSLRELNLQKISYHNNVRSSISDESEKMETSQIFIKR